VGWGRWVSVLGLECLTFLRPRVVVKFELLADLHDAPSGNIMTFEGCDQLGAVNLRGTAYAARDVIEKKLFASIDGETQEVVVNVSGIAGFLLAKTAAAHSRRKTKDWYDIAFVLLHNDIGGPRAAALEVRKLIGRELVGEMHTALNDLAANFESPNCQGPKAYAEQMLIEHPELDEMTLRADAVLAVTQFFEEII
jgi:hypothetical protein